MIQRLERCLQRGGASLAALAIATSLRGSPADGIAGPPPNDDCTNAIWSFVGDNPFTTIGATTDGPAHLACDFFDDAQVNQDIWFHHLAVTGDYLFVGTCGSNFDTKLAVYEGCFCPMNDLNLLACNDDSCALQSTIMVPMTLGNCYTIRVGGYATAAGTGLLNITMSKKKNPCTQSDHDCFTVGMAGCNDAGCCEAVCCVHPFCCEKEWDAQCVALAELLCAAPCDVLCPTGAIQEGEFCGDAVNDGCDMQYGCDGPFPDCCSDHAGPSCSDPACSESVCSYDSFCCEFEWDDICASEACSDPNCQCDPFAGTPWQEIDCGDVICGTLWSSGNQHDTDAYTFGVHGHAYVEWSVASEYPVTISLAQHVCGTEPIAVMTSACSKVTSPLLEPGSYEVSIVPIPFACVDCNAGNNYYVATLSCTVPCPADVTGDSVVDVDDLLLVINSWGGQCYGCWADVNDNGIVNVDDLLAVINGWGTCE